MWTFLSAGFRRTIYPWNAPDSMNLQQKEMTPQDTIWRTAEQ